MEISATARHALARLLREELPRTRDVRWCTVQQLHVTLKFLGELSERQLPGVCEALESAAAFVKPFEIRIADLGVFPSSRNPRVFWCGVDDPSQGCARWLDLADPLLAEHGFPRENRAFHPHVTLGRAKNPAGRKLLKRLLEHVPPPATPPFTVEEVVLFESRLAPTGAVYTPLFKAPLGVDRP